MSIHITMTNPEDKGKKVELLYADCDDCEKEKAAHAVTLERLDHQYKINFQLTEDLRMAQTELAQMKGRRS